MEYSIVNDYRERAVECTRLSNISVNDTCSVDWLKLAKVWHILFDNERRQDASSAVGLSAYGN
jgi:hypothetical protein